MALLPFSSFWEPICLSGQGSRHTWESGSPVFRCNWILRTFCLGHPPLGHTWKPQSLAFLVRYVFGQHLPNGIGMRSNNALELSVNYRGPRLPAARSSWPAAQLGR